jgi:hypothetical protein
VTRLDFIEATSDLLLQVLQQNPSTYHHFVNTHSPDTYGRHHAGERHPRLQTSHITHKTGSTMIDVVWAPCKFFFVRFFQLTNCINSPLGSKYVVRKAAPHLVPLLCAPARRMDGRATTDRKRITGTETGNDRRQEWGMG